MSHKLYILIRDDISPEQQAVQAGHTIAKFLLDNPKTDWSNGTLVYLSVEKGDVDWMEVFNHELYKDVIAHGIFYDPDLHKGPTASYAYGEYAESFFTTLPLMRFNVR